MSDDKSMAAVEGQISKKSRKEWVDLEWEGWVPKSTSGISNCEEQMALELPKPPIFSRSPRHHLVLPTDEVKLLEPPPMPNKPTTSFVQIFLPVVGILIGIVISLYAFQASNSGNGVPLTVFVSVPMVLLSAGAGAYSYLANKRKYETDTEIRKKIYAKYLEKQKDQFEIWKKNQKISLLADNPDVDACIKLVQECKDRKYEAAQRLWERDPEDGDFLYMRMGTGRIRTSFKVIPPDEPRLVLERDPLIDDGIGLANAYQYIDEMPVLLPLRDVAAAGIFGRANNNDVVRSILLQLAAHHAPNEVKVVVVASEEDEHLWRWVRWLPHNWSDNRKSRYFLTDRGSRHIVLSELESLFQQRKSLKDNQETRSASISLPVYVFIFADTTLWTGSEAGPYGPFLDMLLKDGSQLGAYSIFIGNRRVQIPKACDAVIDIYSENANSNKYCGSLEIVGKNELEVEFTLGRIDTHVAETFARTMAAIELESIFEADSLPNRATIVDLFGVKRVDDIQLKDLWEKSKPYFSLHAPIGLRSGNKIAKVDFQEAGRGDGFGSHSMIGGTTGTGKTQFLQTLILLMCAHYKPEYLNFILIDYKGGDLALGLEKLPHLVGTLANVEKEGNQVELIQRLFRSIEVEITRRKIILEGRNINDYIHEQMKNPFGMEPLSHLFVIIDEFAEMILKNPVDDPNKSLMKRLLSIGAIGRSIGVHLILATQNPGTVVGDDLRNNINTRICLRMGTRDASMQILRRADAYEKIKKDEVGRAYIQVGNNDIFELIQVAWGGAPDISDTVLGDFTEINLVDNIGIRSLAVQEQKKDEMALTQLQALTRRISHLALQINSPLQQQVWLPVLPRQVEYEALHLTEAEPRWKASYLNNSQLVYINPMLGLLDDPDNRSQGPLHLDLTKDGHLLVFGSPGNGKTTLLQALISEMVFEHSPEEVALYLLDWGGRNLTIFNDLPHVGAVILPGENERIRRLFSYVAFLFDERLKKFEAADNVKNITDYRVRTKDKMQDIVIVIDNLSAYIEMFKQQATITSPIEIDSLTRIAGEGGALGIHLVLTSTSINLPPRLRERLSLVIALELGDTNDYLQTIGRTGGLFPRPDTPGRGIIRKHKVLEFQTMLPGKGETDPERIASLKSDFAKIKELWKSEIRAFIIPPLNRALTLDAVFSASSAQDDNQNLVYVGKELNSPDLHAFGINLESGPHFWISGAPYSGKTTLLQVWLLALAAKYPPSQFKFYLIDPDESGISKLASLKHVIGCVTDAASLRTRNIEQEINDVLGSMPSDSSSEAVTPMPRVVIAIDDLGIMRAVLTEQPVVKPEYLLSQLNSKQPICNIIASGSPNDFTANYSFPFADAIRKNRNGFLVGTSDNSLTTTFNVKYGIDAGRVMEPGWAFFFRRGTPTLVQVANRPLDALAFDDLIQTINKKWL